MRPKALAFLAGLYGALFIANHAAAQDAIKVGVTISGQSVAAAPESLTGLAGFNIEIIRQICRRIERQCVLQELSFRDLMSSTASGAVDVGVGNTLKTPERARQVLFTAPFWRSTSSFVGKANRSLPNLTALLTDNRVCAIAATRQDAFLKALPGASDKSIVAQPSNQETLQALAAGACEFALVPTLQAVVFLQGPQGAGFAFRGLPLVDQGLGGDVHMIVAPGKPDLLKEINRALEAMIRDGSHERISRRYFPFSIL